MKTNKTVWKSLLMIALLLSVVGPGQAQSNNAISPVGSVLPATFPLGQQAVALLVLTNANPLSNQQLAPGDSFILTFDAWIIGTLAISGAVRVESSSLTGSDFSAAINPSTRKLTIIYNGISKLFGAGDSVSVKVLFTAPAQVGSST